MLAPEFTPQDAQFLIATAQSAPLQNMKHAEAVSQLLQRFQAWYAFQVSPPGPDDEETPT